uniref:Uncharacterized protein n=1 Tax=Aotus nancymaae TaxID=37293 RepID=A0A2K5E2U5_AOTNA
MVSISNKQILDSRSESPWRLSLITDFFWGIAEFVVLCWEFKTSLTNMVKPWPLGNSPQRMSRINHLRGPSPPPMAGG